MKPFNLHPAPAAQGEPAAYISHTSEGDILGWERQFDAPSHTPLYAAPQPAEQQPLKSSLALDAATHLTNWMELDWCECEGGHTCGLNEVRRTRDSLLVAAEQQPAPDVSALVEALEELIDLMEDTRQGEYVPDSFTTQPARIALAAYRKQVGAEVRSAGDYERGDKAATEALGSTLPHDWNGNVQVQGNVTVMIDGKEHVEPAAALGVDPTFWGVYAQLEDGRHYWLADFNTQEQAEELAEWLGLIASHREQQEGDSK